ncbi:MAG TPA: glycine cleavage T C-terminal barrel domain-containing protein [Pyrinomonadaceae bacterium]|jgi:aminomethyltransferase
MNTQDLEQYHSISENGSGFIRQKRGLIAVSGREAVQFLNGLITNDVAKLESYRWMLAAFPNAQGRLLALVRVMRIDEKFLFETESATHEKVYQNLFRFTFAGDFFVEDLSENFTCFSAFGNQISNFKYKTPTENEIIGANFNDEAGFILKPVHAKGFDAFVPNNSEETFLNDLKEIAAAEISQELYERLRIEQGIPLYGVDMDETTIVPELGIDGLISYNKGCYIGQEIIARIHFRGHIAKQLTGLVFEDETVSVNPKDEIKTADGKNAGKITSATYSPKLQKTIALGYVRYDYLAEGTELKIGETTATVKNLPFIEN